jgi:thiosulfate reductase cytochrome b subunit
VTEVHEQFPYFKKHLKRLKCTACHISTVQAPVLEARFEQEDGDEGYLYRYRNLFPKEATLDEGRLGAWKPLLLPLYPSAEEQYLAPFNVVYSLEGSEASLSFVELTHGVAPAKFAVRECRECHYQSLRLPSKIAFKDSKGLEIELSQGTEVISTQDEELLTSMGRVEREGYSIDYDRFFLPGRTNTPKVNLAGIVVVVWVLLFVLIHGGFRFFLQRRKMNQQGEDENPAAKEPKKKLEKVYRYNLYERLWHMVSGSVIILLIISGFAIHKGGVGSLNMVKANKFHEMLAILLIVNSFLSLFYHLTTSRILKFIPREHGIRQRLWLILTYYIRGIFRGDPKPKSSESHMNTLQQITYLVLLNILLPLQILTGVALWVQGYFVEYLDILPPSTILSPIHVLASWLFIAFILLHVYLTTTGGSPLEMIKVMITGWSRVEKDD